MTAIEVCVVAVGTQIGPHISAGSKGIGGNLTDEKLLT